MQAGFQSKRAIALIWNFHHFAQYLFHLFLEASDFLEQLSHQQQCTNYPSRNAKQRALQTQQLYPLSYLCDAQVEEINFLQTSRVYEYCDQKGLCRPQELFQAFRQTKHAAASCTSSPSPLFRPCHSPPYLGSAEPVSLCVQGRLHWGG